MDNKDEKNNNDLELWTQVTKDVTPLQKEKSTTSLTKPPKRPPVQAEVTHDTPVEKRQAIPQPPQIDRKTAQKLQRGQIRIEGRLDLHGKTQNEAYDALYNFIESSYRQKKRCVLVITGKGGKRESTTSMADKGVGVLRRKTPEWLSEPPLNTYILKTQQAKPKDGGEGALYVLLRRER